MLHSKYFDFPRKVDIYIPLSHSADWAQDYDVFYIMDGQNVKFPYMTKAVNLFYNSFWTSYYIIVAIESPFSIEIMYTRNKDLLPDDSLTIKEYRGMAGNSANLARFIKEELKPYINSHYHTSGYELGIGHSLGASFLLENTCLGDLFNNIIAVSPNFSYSNRRLAKEFMQYDWSKGGDRFLFISNAREELEGWEDWKPARELVYNHIAKNGMPENVTYLHKSYPDYEHEASFIPAITEAMPEYFKFRERKINGPLQPDKYRKHIEVIVNEPNAEICITGNQPSLGNFDTSKMLRLKHVNDSVRAIDIDVQLPLRFKFRKVSDPEKEAVIVNSNYNQEQFVESKMRTNYTFRIIGWM